MWKSENIKLITISDKPSGEDNHRYAKLSELFKTTSKDFDTIVKINNTEDLTKYIWDFVKESSQSFTDEDAGVKTMLSSSSSDFEDALVGGIQ